MHRTRLLNAFGRAIHGGGEVVCGVESMRVLEAETAVKEGRVGYSRARMVRSEYLKLNWD